jgi:UDP-N-acetylmuramyl pentapeptide synthase
MSGEIAAVMEIVKLVSNVINNIVEKHKKEILEYKEQIIKLKKEISILKDAPK